MQPLAYRTPDQEANDLDELLFDVLVLIFPSTDCISFHCHMVGMEHLREMQHCYVQYLNVL